MSELGCPTNFDNTLTDNDRLHYKHRCRLLTKMKLQQCYEGTKKLDYLCFFQSFTTEQLGEFVQMTGNQLLEKFPYDDQVQGRFNLVMNRQ